MRTLLRVLCPIQFLIHVHTTSTPFQTYRPWGHITLGTMAGWHIVLKLNRAVSPTQRALAHSYQRAVGAHRFSVLFYAMFRHASSLKENVAAARASLQEPGASPVRLCPYYFGEIKRRYPTMEARLRNSSSWRVGKIDMKFTAFTPRGVTGPELALFQAGLLDGCRERGHWEHLWTVESDAAFVGNPLPFFDAFASDRSDLLSSGYTIGSAPFWGRNLSTFEPPPAFHRS